MTRYDYMNPPVVTEGPAALWTPAQRDAWRAEYERRTYVSDTPEGRSKVTWAVRDFERELWEFANTEYRLSDLILWWREVAFEVSGGTQTLCRPKVNPKAESWVEYRDELRSQFVGELHDEDNFDEGFDPFTVEENQAVLWVLNLEPYRIWQVYRACQDAAEEAVADNLLSMSTDEKGSGDSVQKAARKAMEKAGKALWEEFEKATKSAA